ncbi:MAG: MmcQ/YjbR family DNA-binding protein [bacterium]|nr:MmcQ/YjbR family DNA-binding protein [bacterium]
MATFEDVCRLGTRLPEVTEGTFYGTAALKVRGKGFCRMWSEREYNRDGVHDTEVLVVFCEPEAKSTLLENHSDVLFSTPHYEGYGAMLIRLARVELEDLAEWLEDSYRRRAPETLLRRLDR